VEEDDQKTDGGSVHEHVLINGELKTGKRSINRAGWDRSIKEV